MAERKPPKVTSFQATQQLERGIAFTKGYVHQGLIKNEHTITWPLFPQSLNPLETCPCRDACIVWRRLRPNYGSSHHNCQKQTDTFQFHELLHNRFLSIPFNPVSADIVLFRCPKR